MFRHEVVRDFRAYVTCTFTERSGLVDGEVATTGEVSVITGGIHTPRDTSQFTRSL